ncbi:hypothetical protein [Thiocapsa marina]|uniref:DUF2281 domain-containing protein n=1 Tax=Thiocapsa marina 5811 TaxID=768671 RepID=F9UHJ9_9GAMM|nr:hypothetical protein [Thiocapsa marina]EGV16308.1 hypothetical protein ThimaDRAFT_4402 [Thiocapsa marina 5811]
MPTLPEAIYEHSLRLPESAAREALAFIQQLENRCGKEQVLQTRSSKETESFLAAVAGTLGNDFPDDIDDADLGIDAPRDSLD